MKSGLLISTVVATIVLSMIAMTTLGLNVANAQETSSVEIDGQNYEIEYEITGGTVQNMTADANIQTLIVNINSTDDGTLTIVIPTEVLNADDEFSVFIDSEFGNFVVDEQEGVNGTRAIQIEFPIGAEEIEIIGTSMGPGQQAPNVYSLEIDGQTYEIEYEITGGSVESMSADPNSKSLLVTINSASAGVLEIMLPKAVIDADDEFSVSIDGEGNATADETGTTTEARTLSIDFAQGDSEIEIVGTYIVPEFGVLTAIMLAGGVASVLVVGKRYLKFTSP
jgi:hypothetical protein